ncbi:Crp/Fnr family transcriptional regulator [soil metagenome]
MKTKSKKSGGLPENIRKLIATSWIAVFDANKSVLSFKKGERIYKEGEVIKEMGFLNSGKIKIVANDGESNEHLARLITNGGIVGIRAYGNKMILPVSAIALTDCEITFIPIKVFDEMMLGNINFCYYFMDVIATELRQSEKQMQAFSRMEMRERLALAILMNLNEFGYAKGNKGLLGFTLSRKDFSSIIGTSYETVIRMLSEIEKMKLIRLENKNIRILNEKKLLKMVNVHS